MGPSVGRLTCLALIAVFLCLPHLAQADPFLGRLDCVSLQVNVLESGESFGITPQVLRDALVAGLKNLAPSLKLDPGCPDVMAFKVFIQSITSGQAHGFFGHAALEVRRKAVFRETALLAPARAWDLESYLHGPQDHAKAAVVQHMTRLLSQFTEDYRAANKRDVPDAAPVP
jgi:hypothetical protein